MYLITEEMKALFNQKQRQTVNITVELKEGSAADDFSITEADIISNSFSVDRYCATGENIEIGSAVAAELRFTLDNSKGKFDGISLGGAKLFVRLGIKDWSNADAEMNYMDCGYFTVDENPKPLTQISVAALDNMMRFDRAVNWNNFSFPMTIEDIVSVCCADRDVTLSPLVAFTDLPNGSYTVQNKPSTADITYRQLIQWVAEITGTCAFIDWNGHLCFKWSENTSVEINTSNRYSSTTDESITITGVQITESEENTYLYGEEGSVFNIEGNELIQDNQSVIVENLGAVLCGFTYVPFECSCFPMPYLYPLDIVSFTDIKGNTFDTMVTAHVYTLNGTSSLKGTGENQQQKNYSVSSPFTKRESLIINNLKKRAETNMDRIEKETVDLNKTLANALGLYDTTVKHDDGSITYYYHSKPTLEECAEGDVIFCLNAGGFGVCTTGWKEGKPVFDYGVDAKSGKAIWDYLTVTHKLSASLIEAGILKSTNDKTTFDLDNAVFRSESDVEDNRKRVMEQTAGEQRFEIQDKTGKTIIGGTLSAKGLIIHQDGPVVSKDAFIASKIAEWEKENAPTTWEEYAAESKFQAGIKKALWLVEYTLVAGYARIVVSSSFDKDEGNGIVITPYFISFEEQSAMFASSGIYFGDGYMQFTLEGISLADGKARFLPEGIALDDGNTIFSPEGITFSDGSKVLTDKSTPDEIGAAPAGRGYGEKMIWLGFDESTWQATGTFQEDLEALFKSMPDQTCRQVQFIDVDGLNTQKFYGTLWRYGYNYGVLTALNYSGLKAVRTFYNEVWNDWEWENPPMTPGVPYRTTKRYNGKVVYRLFQNVGNMPSSDKKTVHVASGSGVLPSDYLSFQTFYNGARRIHNGNIFVNDEGTICGRVDILKDKTIELLVFNNKLSDYTITMLIEYTLD